MRDVRLKTREETTQTLPFTKLENILRRMYPEDMIPEILERLGYNSKEVNDENNI